MPKGIIVSLLFLAGCQSPAILYDAAKVSGGEATEARTLKQITGEFTTESRMDADVTVAVIPPIIEPKNNDESLDESLASIPETNPVELVVAVETPIINIWQRIRNGMMLDIPDIKRVKVQRDWYEKHQAYLDRVLTRASPFLYLIVEELDKRNMPMELALLPIVESAYDPFAYSYGRAAGIWQFIPGTGRRYGLKQNWWYDGRRDIVESTRAALDYLEYLHQYFKGDWLHALAAYNSGEGNVARAIKQNRKKHKPTDFWNLKLPNETKAYVPKLLALAELLAKEETFQLKWQMIANKPILKKVDTDGQLDIAYAAKLADISVDNFYKLNPGFNRWSTPPNGPHHLLLPIEKADIFIKKLAASDPSERVRWVRYKVKAGDSLIKVANQYNTTPSILRSVNRIKKNIIRVGQKLLIPTASHSQYKYSLSSENRLQAKQNIQRVGNRINYRVRSGDSFWKISQHYKVNLRKLAAWNGMAPTDLLKINQKLIIWTQQPKTSVSILPVALKHSRRLRKISYRVRKGDSLSRISNKFSVKVADLKRWNQYLQNKKYLQPGEKLTVYVDITRQSGS